MVFRWTELILADFYMLTRSYSKISRYRQLVRLFIDDLSARLYKTRKKITKTYVYKRNPKCIYPPPPHQKRIKKKIKAKILWIIVSDVSAWDISQLLYYKLFPQQMLFSRNNNWLITILIYTVLFRMYIYILVVDSWYSKFDSAPNVLGFRLTDMLKYM